MVGDYGTIVSSRFSTMLHEGKIKKDCWANQELKKLFVQIIIISALTAVFSSALALIISGLSNYTVGAATVSKIFSIVIIDVISLVSILFFISVYAGIYLFKKKEDPNNFLIPITTSVADFGNMIILSLLILLFF
jgi:cation transporter-like permease